MTYQELEDTCNEQSDKIIELKNNIENLEEQLRDRDDEIDELKS